MAFEDSITVLNELLAIHYRSLPMYLTLASPWKHRGDEKATELLKDVVEDQQETCRKVAELVVQRGAVVETGEFPTHFTELHFLSLDFMLQELVKTQRDDLTDIERCAQRLWNDPPAEAIAREAVGAARGHLQSLEEIVAETTKVG